jgi:uncharacterized protein (TIGR00730 family)
VSHRNPARAMDKSKPAICVFCGSSFGSRPGYAAAARTLGQLIAERGYSLVYGGGAPGLMGETARAVRGGGADVAGVLPEFLRWIERPPEWEQNLTITPDLQLRKTRMLAMSDAFVVLPGGAGTMDEFFEVVSSANLQILPKPIVVVDTDGFIAPLQALMEHIVREGFAKPALLATYKVVATPEAAMDEIDHALGPLAGQ